MTLLSPAFLWAFLALLPLAAVYFLKVRPRKKSTSAYFLWEKIFSEKRATSLFNKLRDLLSLLLMALAFAALAFALCRPEFGKDDRKDLLILIDHSASMAAKNGLGTRLDSAREAAREIAIALNGKPTRRRGVDCPGNGISLASLGQPPPAHRRHRRNRADRFFLSPRNRSRALCEDAHWSKDYRIILISDGSFAGADALPENVELLKTGAPSKNLGIVGADLQQLPDGRMGFYFQIASSFEEKTKADLVLKLAETDQIFKLIPLEVEPGVNPPEIFYLDDAPAGKMDRRAGFGRRFCKRQHRLARGPAEAPRASRGQRGESFLFRDLGDSF